MALACKSGGCRGINVIKNPFRDMCIGSFVSPVALENKKKSQDGQQKFSASFAVCHFFLKFSLFCDLAVYETTVPSFT